ncbi:MAG: hypothetical protein OJK14_21565, partial [Achromobacter sp.]|uniref:hypothetical protein n=1 Tax=Achromobacter sp. TaxID=134375 RepID=UPI002585362E
MTFLLNRGAALVAGALGACALTQPAIAQDAAAVPAQRAAQSYDLPPAPFVVCTALGAVVA